MSEDKIYDIKEITSCVGCPHWYVDSMGHCMCKIENKDVSDVGVLDKPYWCPVDKVMIVREGEK